jgi:hypothetical protein
VNKCINNLFGEKQFAADFRFSIMTVKIKPKSTAMCESKIVKFYDALKVVLKNRGREVENLGDLSNPAIKRILEDYGAMFLAADAVLAPPVCMFADADAVARFQIQVDIAAENFNGVTIELQAAALKALCTARRAARNLGLDITPRGGAEAARRSFDDTLRLWDSRFAPALSHWTERGAITAEEAIKLKDFSLLEQITAVLELEKQGVFFSKDFSKSILYSVAAPGCSQHLSLLAFDANEFQTEPVREILARYGWFRTVQSDLPHFTFLGYKEDDLPTLGLKRLETDEGEFWIPNV